MAQALPTPNPREVRVTIRLPGWLLAAVALLLLAMLGTRAIHAYRDDGPDPSPFGTAARAQVLAWTAEGGVFHALLLVETSAPLAPDEATWQLELRSDGPQPAVPAAAVARPAASGGQRAALVDLFAAIPEGATPSGVAFQVGQSATGSLPLPAAEVRP